MQGIVSVTTSFGSWFGPNHKFVKGVLFLESMLLEEGSSMSLLQEANRTSCSFSHVPVWDIFSLVQLEKSWIVRFFFHHKKWNLHSSPCESLVGENDQWLEWQQQARCCSDAQTSEVSSNPVSVLRYKPSDLILLKWYCYYAIIIINTVVIMLIRQLPH